MNTNNWKLDLFSSLDSSSSFQSILNAALGAIRSFGFDFCGWRTMPTEKSANIVAINTIEDEVYTTLINGGYEEGPIPCHCAHSMTPISWRGTSDDEVFQQSPKIMEEYYGLGHKGGWAITTMSLDGTKGMFYVESQHPLTSSEVYYAEQHMQWVSAATYMRILEIKDASQIVLSNKEKYFLETFCNNNGNLIKTAEQMKINISLASYYINDLKKRFECNDVYSLISRAIFLRLIT